MIIIIALVLYILFGTFIAMASRKHLIKGDPSDYFIASGRLSGFISAMTYAATTYSAFMMVGLVGLAYATGVGALGFELVYFVGTLFLLSILAPRAWKLSREKGFITPSGMLGILNESRTLSLTVALISLIALIPYSSIQLIGVAKLFEGMMNIPNAYLIGLIIASGLTIAWSIVGGLRGIAWTDAFQGMIMITTSIFLLLWCITWGFGNIDNFVVKTSHILSKLELDRVPNWYWNVNVFLAYTIPWFFFAVTNPQVVQRLYIPKDTKALKQMIIYFALFGLLYTIIVTLLGISIRVLAEEGIIERIDPLNKSLWNLVTPKFLNYPPPIISIPVIIGIISAAITTIDSIILTLSSMIVKDVVLQFKPHLYRSAEVKVGQILVLIFTMLLMFFGYFKPAFIVDLAVLSSTLLLSLAPITIGSLLFSRKPSKIFALTSTLMGILIVSIAEFLKAVLHINIARYIPIPLIIILISATLYIIGLAMGRERT